MPLLWQHQTAILRSPARFKLAACGRRWGKTVAAVVATVLGHGEEPGDLPGLSSGARLWWVAPNTTQLRASRAWDLLKAACPGARIWEQIKRIELRNGGSVDVMSAESLDALRGPGLDGVVIDEAAYVPVYLWEAVLRQALIDTGGWALFLSTPNGRNWFWERFRDADSKPDWQAWQLPTSDNPHISAAELTATKAEIGPRRFAQEHEAQFTEIEGALWPGDYFEDVWATDAEWPESFRVSALAVDPALGGGDFSAAVFVGFERGLLWIDAHIQRQPPNELVAASLAMWRRLRPTFFVLEANGFQQLLSPIFAQAVERMGMPPVPVQLIQSREKKEIRIQRLDPYLANRRLRFRRTADCATLVEQLQMFPSPQYHDDGPDALEMAVRMLTEATT